MKGRENLTAEEDDALKLIRDTFEDIAVILGLKESLRNIYKNIRTDEVAALSFDIWCQTAERSGVPEAVAMAKTVRRHWDGILAHWKTRISSASMEGFNTKIRWLIKQAYGYRDDRYFVLKIFDLPNIKTERSD